MSKDEPDPILLSLFAARFMSVAEAMGRSLQQTSISTNVKERLDFSCALFSPDGELVSNAPHIPIHLGAMSFAVKYQIDLLMSKDGDGIHPGDCILANHPEAGGSHLPDVTCITPVFAEKGEKIIFFTASRAHHADIGGISAGSMPPHSHTIYEEGAQIKSFKVVSKGVFDQKGLVYHFCEAPAKYPGCSGSRCFRDVESDIRAQIAANQKGVNLIHTLVEEWDLKTVQDVSPLLFPIISEADELLLSQYMRYIRNNAELAVRNLLKDVAKRENAKELYAEDYMDDGSPICLKITIDEKSGDAIFDFEGTGLQSNGNFNCPTSIVYSAILYCLRAMIDQDIPLNHGCIVPVEVKIPQGSFLDPSDDAAVVGGNVLTSQRITDVVLKAFDACAASQGCMNNLSFGLGGTDEKGNHVEGFGLYETIAGGSGAGPGWHGTSGVHTHQTNTRITDPEIMERRYPVVLRQFSIRDGSGGDGEFRGGDGVVREIEFLPKELQVSILSERRVFRPFGMHGGRDAKAGLNVWVKSGSNRRVNMGGKTAAKFYSGDRIIINTPGGGGWGAPKGASKAAKDSDRINHQDIDTKRGSLAEREALSHSA